jgi:outer membrane protein assembly factor BamB
VSQPGGTLYIGLGGHVVAIDTATGEELWRTKLKIASCVTLTVRSGAVFGGAAGELFCLDPSTGAVRWRNRLPGLGMGLLTFGENAAAIAADAAASVASAGG